jgi:hypothetical protein
MCGSGSRRIPRKPAVLSTGQVSTSPMQFDLPNFHGSQLF